MQQLVLKLVFLNFIISFALLEMFLIDPESLVAVSGSCILNIQVSHITAGLFLDWPQKNPPRVNQHNNSELLIQKSLQSARWFPLNFIQLLTTANHNTVLWLFYLSVISHAFHKQPFKQTTGGRQINENP